MNRKVYLVCGSPGSGKTWACERVSDKFCYIPHDDFIKGPVTHLRAVCEAAMRQDKPVVTEVPFSVVELKNPLEARGFKVTCVFIVESRQVLVDRYTARDGRHPPERHITQMLNYPKRAREWKCFAGTSSEVLEHLKSV